MNIADAQIMEWEEDGLIISSRYQEKIAADGINSAKSLGERNYEKDFIFYSKLFEGIHFNDNISILDIGCGKGDLLAFINKYYPEVRVDKYLGLDIVASFIDVAQSNYPQYEFKMHNFVSKKFLPEEYFEIVVANGVLISRVRNYRDYIEYFVEKMLTCSSRHILFNLIAEVDSYSENYINYREIGRSTTFSKQVLESILKKLDNISYNIAEQQIFPDATDMFIRIDI
ncbi:type 12 methyltransferase [Calothrix parasitica NIES-267]|uniref:Type 12 methyltransferase n=1 Tax=Calothrix parasitica NIES-267 TaxID=1973488 RepID=A0A1Z4LHN5_9CYAN|nr:type 12 methyltransferase [Calothrix parasitica NIES-267]